MPNHQISVSVFLIFAGIWGAQQFEKPNNFRGFIPSLRVKSGDKAVLASEGDWMGDRSIRI